jgi:hypothetical protein
MVHSFNISHLLKIEYIQYREDIGRAAENSSINVRQIAWILLKAVRLQTKLNTVHVI